MCGMTVMMRFGKVGERTDPGHDSRSLPLLLTGSVLLGELRMH